MRHYQAIEENSRGARGHPHPFTGNENRETIEAKMKVLQCASPIHGIGINKTKPTLQGPSLGKKVHDSLSTATAFQTKNGQVYFFDITAMLSARFLWDPYGCHI
jgi:hypothetical protein